MARIISKKSTNAAKNERSSQYMNILSRKSIIALVEDGFKVMSDMSQNSSVLLNELSQRVVVVLVQTSHSGNIGAVARALKNMGLCRLHLVSPKQFPSEEAVARSSGASEILDVAKVFDSLVDAVADASYVVGASARMRSFPWPIMSPRGLSGQVVEQLTSANTVDDSATGDACTDIALVFGRESSGLTNEELQQCNAHVNIPANPDYSSLNLAMAVQVISYELRMACLNVLENDASISPVLGPESAGWDAEPSTVSEVEGMLEHLTKVMTATNYYDPENPGLLLPRLRRLFQRRGLDKMELNILRGILKSVERKL